MEIFDIRVSVDKEAVLETVREEAEWDECEDIISAVKSEAGWMHSSGIFVNNVTPVPKNEDLIPIFIRLWGQLEATRLNARDEDISDELLSYDSEEMMKTVTKWADEYDDKSDTDMCDYFNGKVNELIRKD